LAELSGSPRRGFLRAVRIAQASDEKFVTERAYERLRVEDLVRGIAARLVDDARFAGFRVAAENFESIHNHSAYAGSSAANAAVVFDDRCGVARTHRGASSRRARGGISA
jgi:hypothetical protein